MRQMVHYEQVCTDPSHPPMIRSLGQKTLFEQVREAISNHEREGLSREEIASRVSCDFIPRMTLPSDSVSEGFRLQQMRQQIARDWKDVFQKFDNLAHLTGWFINDCDRDPDPSGLHFTLCQLAFEAIRNVFATVNQLRSALSEDTFGYLRTLHETLVKSRFLKEYTQSDPDLPGRFAYYTNTVYLDFYRRFASSDDENAPDNTWVEAERFYEGRFQRQGKGDYGWVYPLVKSKSGKPIVQPTFRHLMETVDPDSPFSQVYYDVSTSKTHGQFVWNPLMVRPEGRGTNVDSFNVGNIGLVLDLMLPPFEDILGNTANTCTVREHATVMSIVKATFKDIRGSAATIKASNPCMHLGVDGLSRKAEA